MFIFFGLQFRASTPTEPYVVRYPPLIHLPALLSRVKSPPKRWMLLAPLRGRCLLFVFIFVSFRPSVLRDLTITPHTFSNGLSNFKVIIYI